jgi:peptidoglycan/xylan/chitin deacetylase (PgdA/CDA1 family)
MSLPDDYLRYPHRRRGMDHDRYAWSILPRRRPVAWPDGARVALWIVPALTWFPLDGTGKPFRAPGGLLNPYPDYRHYTHRDYGSRVGIFRIFKALDELGLRASVAMNAAIAARHPSLVAEVNARGWEVVAHGVDMDKLHHGGLDPEVERQRVREALGTLRRISGQRVSGWLSPAKSESANTLDLVAAEGVEYVCDWINDDMPYEMRTAHGAVFSMPHAHEIDDYTILVQNHHSEAEFVEQVKDQFDTLYAEAEGQGGRILAITLNPWVIGCPYRVRYLREALDYVVGHKGVWSATGQEILDAFRRQG